MADLSLNLCGVKLKNPIIAASGTFGFGREFDTLYDIGALGGISVKGLSLKPRTGNPPSRIAETPSGMLNSVGLQNPGVDSFIENDLPWLMTKDVAILANITGTSMDEYCRMAQKLAPTGVHLLEMNISCPNVHEGGVAFGVKPESVYAITKAVKAVSRQPLIVKLTPNVADITENALAAQEAGADALSMINTLTGIAVDVHRRSMVLRNNTGGLSGPAVRPVALRMVWQSAQKVSIPIIGMGGIETGEDAAAFMLCGAKAVMVGTANFTDPFACPRIIGELNTYCEEQGIACAQEMVGTLKAY
ncbi:MAG TPA: dihydroorotate dehydrogenase [Candidatus Ventricola intestinavium]|nr:dihydroorotate dehydrogenase [Candidatus Ventricola intestinavium]